ncbi:MAG: hypothetical protein GF330_03410 [Candidatus Eisenbacteria bacterium]|nr:hypothetical protein [Candidatus Eisenbacteria bacterium]
MRTLRPCPSILLSLALLISAGSTEASQTQQFLADRAEELHLGELDGVGVTPDGALILAPVAERIFFGEAAYVWSVLPDGAGGVYAASGSDGQLFRIPAEGTPAVAAETFEYELFALTGDERGALYFAGAPNGTVTRLDPDGSSDTLIDLPEGLVWSLLAAPDGRLYAGTGDRGEVYEIAPDGETRALGAVPDAHVVCMRWHAGRLLCGTDGRGLLVALDPRSGEAEVLYDTGQEEIVALLPSDDGRLLFAANGQREEEEPGNASGGPLMLAPIEVQGGGGSDARLYERLASGLVREIWRCPEEDILDLARAPDGRVLVGTGSAGRLYALDAYRSATRLLDFPEAQLLSLVVEGQQLFVGTGNGGAVYRCGWTAAREGQYTSRVWDAHQTVAWGVADWIASGIGNVLFETRSGHLRNPDETWSPWATLAEGRIASPAARYLQWRVTMQSAADGDLHVRAVRVPYRGPNRAPLLASLSVTPQAGALESVGGSQALRQQLPGGVEVEYSLSDSDGSSSPSRSGLWARTLRSASWEAFDPDGDPLRFELHLHPLEGAGSVRLEEDLERAAFTWDGAAWPDGWYELRVVASDAPGNGPQEALRAERRSAPFRIDNTPPRWERLDWVRQGEDWVLSGVARDAGGRLAELQISLDGAAWRPIHPRDGILDSPREEIRAPLPARADGGRPEVVAVRAADEVGHLAVERLVVPED